MQFLLYFCDVAQRFVTFWKRKTLKKRKEASMKLMHAVLVLQIDQHGFIHASLVHLLLLEKRKQRRQQISPYGNLKRYFGRGISDTTKSC